MEGRETKMDKQEVPAILGEEIGGKGRNYFDNVLHDNLLDALLELTASVWTYHDRVNVLEKILASKGIDVTEAIEAHVPDAAELAKRSAERDALVERVFGAFIRRPNALSTMPSQEG
jgi:uncharacterized ferritin-like protein (DUF455 family)